jgi:hypothetical protein
LIPSVTFGASDMPLKLDQLDKDGLIQFPTVIGGAVAMNVRCTRKPIVHAHPSDQRAHHVA